MSDQLWSKPDAIVNVCDPMKNLGQADFTHDPTWFGPWYIFNSMNIAVIVSYNSIITRITTQYNNSKLQI